MTNFFVRACRHILFTLLFSALALSLSLTFALPAVAQQSDDPLQLPPAETWTALNEGWSGVYSELEQHLDPDKNYVVWSIIAPKKPLDLRRADSFREFLQHNPSKNISISHNLVAWRCQVPNGDYYMGATGFSGERTGQSAKMVKAGWGLTTFLATFTDGWLSPSIMTGTLWDDRNKKEDVYSLAVEVSGQSCEQMLRYLHDFIMHPDLPMRKFGLRVDPEKFEGGGCISFASSLLQRAGILPQMLKASNRDLWANMYRFGGNDLPLPEATTVPRLQWREGQKPRKIGISQFFSQTWNASIQGGVKLSLLDPELMLWGMKNLDDHLLQNTREVIHFPGDCVRGESCLLRRSEKIDDHFDKQTARVSSLARAWKKNLENQGYRMQMLTLRESPFLIFQKP